MENIGVKYIIDLALKSAQPLKNTMDDIKRITRVIKENNNAILENQNKFIFASQKRKANLQEEQALLSKQKNALKYAFNADTIKQCNDAISETTKRIQLLKGKSNGIFNGGLVSKLSGYAAGAFSIYEGFNLGKSSIASYDRQMKANAQLRASLESTGYVAGKTFDELEKNASELESKTLFPDEDISGAQSLLITFKKVRGEIFDKATPAILDLATKLNINLKEATIQVGKALEDPIRGLSNLRRSGIQFTEEQEANIKKLVDVGKLQEAQLIIINELQSQFGGSAEAAAKTGLGPWQQLGNIWDNTKEKLGGIILKIGNGLLPVIKSMIAGIGKSIDFIKEHSEAFKLGAKIVVIATSALVAYKLTVFAIPKLMALASAAQAAYGFVVSIMSLKVGAATAAMAQLNATMLINPWALAIAGITGVVVGIALLVKKTKEVNVIKQTLNDINATAVEKMADEKVKIQLLTNVIQDNNVAYKERKNKLDELKALSPEYFGNLKLEKDGVDGITEATYKYIEAFRAKVYEEAIAAKRTDYIKKMFDQEEMMIQGNNEELRKGIFDIPLEMNIGPFKLGLTKQRSEILEALKKEYNGFEIVAANYMKKYFPNFKSDLAFSPEIKKVEEGDTIKGGEGIKNINITIGKLVESISVTSATMEKGADDFAAKVKEVFLNAVNDANYQMS